MTSTTRSSRPADLRAEPRPNEDGDGGGDTERDRLDAAGGFPWSAPHFSGMPDPRQVPRTSPTVPICVFLFAQRHL